MLPTQNPFRAIAVPCTFLECQFAYIFAGICPGSAVDDFPKGRSLANSAGEGGKRIANTVSDGFGKKKACRIQNNPQAFFSVGEVSQALANVASSSLRRVASLSSELRCFLKAPGGLQDLTLSPRLFRRMRNARRVPKHKKKSICFENPASFFRNLFPESNLRIFQKGCVVFEKDAGQATQPRELQFLHRDFPCNCYKGPSAALVWQSVTQSAATSHSVADRQLWLVAASEPIPLIGIRDNLAVLALALRGKFL